MVKFHRIFLLTYVFSGSIEVTERYGHTKDSSEKVSSEKLAARSSIFGSRSFDFMKRQIYTTVYKQLMKYLYINCIYNILRSFAQPNMDRSHSVTRVSTIINSDSDPGDRREQSTVDHASTSRTHFCSNTLQEERRDGSVSEELPKNR